MSIPSRWGRSRTRPGQAAEARTEWFVLWDGYFAICYLVAVVLVFNSVSGSLGSVVATGALTVMILWYASLGRGLMLKKYSSRRRAIVFSVGLLALFGVAVAYDLAAAVALFAIVPMLVIALPMWFAVPCLLLAHLWPVTLVWFRGGDVNMSVLGILPLSLIGITMSILLGIWISQVVRQSGDRATLIAQLQLSQDHVAQLSRDAGVAAERERLSHEIHDTLAQGLVSINGLVQAAEAEMQANPTRAREHLLLASTTASENLAEAREFVQALTPPALRGRTLAQAVHGLSDTLREQTMLDVEFSVRGTEQRIPTAASVVLLRSAQETMTNVRKHAASARKVAVTLTFSNKSTSICVSDDGDGITPKAEQHGYGLRGIRARAQEVDGTLVLENGVDGGTIVTITVPVAASTNATKAKE